LRARALRNGEVINDVIDASAMPDVPRSIPRPVLIFDEYLAAVDREEVLARLRLRIPRFVYEEAPVGDVLKQLFAVSGINYIILDGAIGEETLTLSLVDESIEGILGTMQNMVDLNFNYHGGTVYVTDSTNAVLVPEIVRLSSGLTNVLAQPSLEGVSGGGGGNNGGGNGVGDAGGSSDLFGGAGGGGGDGETDLERFLDRIPELVDWPDGSTWYLERKSNTLFLRSSPATIAEVKRLLHALDFNNIMVRIDTKFIEVSDEAYRQLGVDWKVGGFSTSGSNGVIAGGAQSGGTLAGDLFTNLGVLSNPELSALAGAAIENGINAGSIGAPAFVGTPGTGLSMGIIGAGTGMNPNFEATIQALESKGKANTLSEPTITTLSNATGLIDISRDVVFVEDIENRGIDSDLVSTDGNVISNTVNLPVPRYGSDSEGIRLRVVPSVARNSDIITLAIFPAVRELVGFQSQVVVNPQASGSTNEIQQPEFATRALSTAVHVQNGQTVVMGGLISERSREVRRGIPFLSGIPWAGQLFRTDTEEFERRRLLIFVTASIIDPSGAAYNDEELILRDKVSVVLPASVQQELQRQQAEAQAEALTAASEAATRMAAEESDDADSPSRSWLEGRNGRP
jgi:type II secretory pathway component GspD/PulD (secretin)